MNNPKKIPHSSGTPFPKGNDASIKIPLRKGADRDEVSVGDVKISFAFFGSSRFSVIVLDELEKAGLIPLSVVTTPDKPVGRKLAMTPTPVKEWALRRNIAVLEPIKLDSNFIEQLQNEGKRKKEEGKYDLFIVASYGKIIPASIIDLPPRDTLNIHPSLLPKYRGASPLQSAMLDDAKDTGVTIMRINEKMDEGPIVAQKEIHVNEWPTYEEFEESMAREGGQLLARILPDWVEGKITEQPQNDLEATYTKKISKEDGLIDLHADPHLNFRKIQAFHEWPQAYFFINHSGKQLRVKITKVSFKNTALTIEKIIPEGGKEMNYEDFLRGYKK